MSRLDVLLLALLAFFAVRGFLRGFLRESFGLAGLVAGVLLAAAEGELVAAWLRGRALVPAGSELLAASLAILLGVWLAAVLLGRLAESIARAVLLGGVNRVAGVVIGSVKGAALLGVGLLVAERVWPSVGEAVATSRVARPLVQLAREGVELGRRLGTAPAGGRA